MLFKSNIEPSCAYCRFSTALGDDEYVCSERGIMSGYGSCGSYRYEPTKREPQALPDLRSIALSEEEFTL